MIRWNVRKPATFVLCVFLIVWNLSCQRNKVSNVSKISIYFVEWSLTTFSRMSCDDLESSQAPIVITETCEIQAFVNALKNADLTEQRDFDGLDVRICCVLEDKSGNVVAKVSFSPTSLMQIDGNIYNTDKSLFQLVLSHLPPGYLMQ